MTDSSPTIVDRFISMSVKAKLFPSKGGCPSTVENLLVSKQGRRKVNRRLELFSIVLFALSAGVVGRGVTSALADEAGIEVDLGEVRSAILSLFAPAGAVATESNPNYKGAAAPAPAAPPSPTAADWPSYNKTLTSERFSDLSQINTKNVAKQPPSTVERS